MTVSIQTGVETTARTRIHVEEFSIYGGEQPLHYRSDADELVPCLPHVHGAVLVMLDVDGEHDTVAVELCQSDSLDVLDRSIEALTTVRERLEHMEPADSREFGRCMASGDWGRCKLTTMHDPEPHSFPSESEWEARAKKRFPAA